MRLFAPEEWPDISRNAAASLETLKSFGPLNSMELMERSEQNVIVFIVIDLLLRTLF